MKEFADVANLVTLIFYGYTFRLDVMRIQGGYHVYAVSKRSVRHDDDSTTFWYDIIDAREEFKSLTESVYSLSSFVADLK